jgi:hypothetical protein
VWVASTMKGNLRVNIRRGIAALFGKTMGTPQQTTTSPDSVFHFFEAKSAQAFGAIGRPEFDAFLKECGDYDDTVQCPFCQSSVGKWSTYEPREESIYYGDPYTEEIAEDKDIDLATCSVCGWFRYRVAGWAHGDYFPVITHSVATLGKNLVGHYPGPFIELDKYLNKNWSERKDLTAGRAEQLIASIFKAHLDCEIIYTTNGVYTPDGGIDFVLVNSNSGIEYAFQLKRRLVDSSERIQHVREFIGAIASSPYKYAYYVTTADRFTKSAEMEIERNALNLAARDIRLSLVDGNSLRALLKEKKAVSATAKSIRAWFRKNSVWSGNKSLDQMISEAFPT